MVVEILCACFGCPLHGKSLRAIRRAALAGRTAFRLPYVKYSTGANETTRTAYRALGKPDWTAARRAFLAERTISEWHAEAKCFFRRVSAIPHPQRLFSPHSFLARQKRMGRRRPFPMQEKSGVDTASTDAFRIGAKYASFGGKKKGPSFSGEAPYFRTQTLNRKFTTSPSCMTYSLPSLRSRPFALALASVPQALRSSKAITSARMKPRSKSE